MTEKRTGKSEQSTTRRNFLGLAVGAGALYAVDRMDLMVRAEHALNPFHDESRPLTPESYKITIPWLPDTVRYWEDAILEMAEKYEIDPDLIAIVMTIESGGASQVSSEVGAKGLMQIMPDTEKDIASKFLKEPRTDYDIWDPRTNIEFGVAYVAYLRDEFGTKEQGPDWDSTTEIVAAGYNGGPGAANSLDSGRGLESEQTIQHSRDTVGMWRERNAVASPTYQRWYERGGSRLINLAMAE